MSASLVVKTEKSVVKGYQNIMETERSFLEDEATKPKQRNILPIQFSVEGSGEEPVKNRKDISLLLVPTGGRQRGAEHHHLPQCVRRSTKPPRAPRVRSTFNHSVIERKLEQRLLFHHSSTAKHST